jgi:hypothetical protein
VRRHGEAVQEHDRASPTGAGLAIGDLDAVDPLVTAVHPLNLLACGAPRCRPRDDPCADTRDPPDDHPAETDRLSSPVSLDERLSALYSSESPPAERLSTSERGSGAPTLLSMNVKDALAMFVANTSASSHGHPQW